MTSARHRAGPSRVDRARPQAGFSVVELIVSLTLFAVLVGSLVTIIATGLSVARNNKDRSVAAHLASQEMDAIRQESFSSLTIGQSARTTRVNQVPYRVKTDLEWVANSATTNACDSTGSSPRVLRASVTVTWPNMRGVEPVKTSTEITPPVSSYDPDSGHIAVRVRDRAGAPLGGVPVRVTGIGTDTTQTTVDESGCAFFGFLAPGTYAVTLGTPGWVDRQSDAVPSQSVGVREGAITSTAFDYDEGASVDLSLEGIHGGTVANAVPVVVANTGLLPAGVKSIAGVGVRRTLSSLFPFADGFQMWAGGCADADPEGQDDAGSRIWPGGTRDPAVTVEPGGTATATVTMPTLHVEFERPATGAAVSVVAIHDPDSSCGSGETLVLGTFTGTSGDMLVALPFGTWTVQAVGESPESTWDTVTLDPSDGSVVDARVRLR